MSRKTTVLALAGLAMHSTGALAADMFSFNAYGTLGAVHSSEDQADFRGNLYQPNGAGYTESTSLNPDSKLAVQAQAKFSDKWSAVVQLVSQHQYDGTYTPQVEWANIKYSITKDLDIRVGRIVSPAFLYSETRNVGYSNPWVRAPQEIYNLNTITSNDGGDISYRFKVGGLMNTVQVFYGLSEANVPGGIKFKGKPNYGFNDTLTTGDLTVRVGYVANKIDVESSEPNPLLAGLVSLGDTLTTFGFQQAGAQALALNQKYSLSGVMVKNLTAGASYDPGKWFVITEGSLFNGEGAIADVKAWYVTGGYRIAKFTPYMTYASTTPDVKYEPGIDTTGLPGLLAAGATQLNDGLNTMLSSFANSQKTISAGVRWDFISNAALKVQFDHIKVGTNSAGYFANTQPGFQTGSSANLISAAVDFAF